MIRLISFVIFLLLPYSYAEQKTEKEQVDYSYQLAEDKFMKQILNGYDKDVMPKKDGEPVTISLSVYVYHIAAESPTQLKVFANLFASWKDERLGWNPADYNGKKTHPLTFYDSIWEPKIITLTPGFKGSTSMTDYVIGRKTLKVDSMDRTQYASVRATYHYSFGMECTPSGGFPFEILDCAARFTVPQKSKDVQLYAIRQAIMYKKIDGSDNDIHMNGWKILSGTQKIRKLDYSNDEISDEPLRRWDKSVFECKFRLQRDGWTLPIIIYAPQIAVLIVITFSYTLKASYAIYVQSIVLYILSTIVRYGTEKVPTYTDFMPGADLSSLFLYFANCFALFFHLLLLHFLPQFRTISNYITPHCKKLPAFQYLEDCILAIEQKPDDLPVFITYLRICIALCHPIIFILILFI